MSKSQKAMATRSRTGVTPLSAGLAPARRTLRVSGLFIVFVIIIQITRVTALLRCVWRSDCAGGAILLWLAKRMGDGKGGSAAEPQRRSQEVRGARRSTRRTPERMSDPRIQNSGDRTSSRKWQRRPASVRGRGIAPQCRGRDAQLEPRPFLDAIC